MEEFLIPFLVTAAQQYPMLMTILMVIGVLRAVNKPLFALWRSYVQATPTKADDEILDTIERSKITKAILFVLDWTASIRIPEKTQPVELPKGNGQ